jgi:hypothetical protein
VIRTLSIGMLVLLGGCGGGCNQPPTPSSETCTGVAQGTVTSLDIGRFDGTTYTRYQDGDTIPLVEGGQGSPMLIVNLRARGSDLGDCLPQTTYLSSGGAVVVVEERPLVVEQVLPDTWVSGDELLISYEVYAGDLARIEATAGGITTEVNVWVDYMGFLPDAGVLPDAAGPDAAPPDAGL